MSKVRKMIGAWSPKLGAENREKIGLKTTGLSNPTVGQPNSTFRIMMTWKS